MPPAREPHPPLPLADSAVSPLLPAGIPNSTLRIRCVDSHTAGEPTRTLPDGLDPMAGAKQLVGGARALREALDGPLSTIARQLVLEPRGYPWLVGAIVAPPLDPAASFAVVFFNNVGTLGMCGHGTIGVMHTLAWMGRITPGDHVVETPVGLVRATLDSSGLVAVRNVVSRCFRRHVPLDVPGHGRIHGDIAWGGNWFFICHDHGQLIEKAHIAHLTTYCRAVRAACDSAALAGDDGAAIDHIELATTACAPGANCRNFVLCPGGEYDRSPCGTGTSARIACLAAVGELQPGATWVQESVIGTRFEASYEMIDGDCHPTIKGCAEVTMDGHIMIDASSARVRS